MTFGADDKELLKHIDLPKPDLNIIQDKTTQVFHSHEGEFPFPSRREMVGAEECLSFALEKVCWYRYIQTEFY